MQLKHIKAILASAKGADKVALEAIAYGLGVTVADIPFSVDSIRSSRTIAQLVSEYLYWHQAKGRSSVDSF